MIDIPELLDLTISFLETKDHLVCLRVSRLWYQIALPHLWRDADGENCEGSWPCIHRASLTASLAGAFGSFLEKYRHFIWSINWQPTWLLHYYSHVLSERRHVASSSSYSPSSACSPLPPLPPSLKTIRFPVFSLGGNLEFYDLLTSVLTDTPHEAFQKNSSAASGNGIRDYDLAGAHIRFFWQLILDTPSLQRIEFNFFHAALPMLDFKGEEKTGEADRADLVLTRAVCSPGGRFLFKVFQSLPQLKHFKAPWRENAACFLQILANLSRSPTTAATDTTTTNFAKGPSSLSFHSLSFRPYITDEITVDNHRRLLEGLTNHHIRRLEVEKMQLIEIDLLMTILPALEYLHVQAKHTTRIPDPGLSLFLDSDQWTLTPHSALRTLRLETNVSNLLSSHVIWTNLEKFIAPYQSLLWVMGLLLQRMPRVKHVELGTTRNEHKSKYSIVQQYKAKEIASATTITTAFIDMDTNTTNAAATTTNTRTETSSPPPLLPLSVQTLISGITLNRTNSAMLSLLPRMPLLTRLELKMISPEVLRIIARDFPLMEHLNLTCAQVCHREIHAILSTCSRLKTLRGTGLEVRAIDLIQRPMVCLCLEEFECAIKGIPRLTKEETNTLQDLQLLGKDGLMDINVDEACKCRQQKQLRRLSCQQQRSVEMQREVLEQLARLTKLRYLALSFEKKANSGGCPLYQPVVGDSRHRRCPELLLGTGLELLVSLQELETFEFNGILVGVQELDWFTKHWPKIKSVKGAVQTPFGVWTRLRPPIVFSHCSVRRGGPGCQTVREGRGGRGRGRGRGHW